MFFYSFLFWLCPSLCCLLLFCINLRHAPIWGRCLANEIKNYAHKFRRFGVVNIGPCSSSFSAPFFCCQKKKDPQNFPLAVFLAIFYDDAYFVFLFSAFVGFPNGRLMFLLYFSFLRALPISNFFVQHFEQTQIASTLSFVRLKFKLFAVLAVGVSRISTGVFLFVFFFLLG